MRRSAARLSLLLAIALTSQVSLAAAAPPGAQPVWKRIPAGTFTMGCVKGDDRCGDEDAHAVTLTRPFDMAETETTNGAYRQCVEAGACGAPTEWTGKDDLPVGNITWEDTVAFCQWVGGRLPTEAEWEYAARGGKSGLIYANGSTITHDEANFQGTGGRDKWKEAAPVKSFPPNEYGLYDMAGNAWEWVNDWHGGMDRKPATDPKGPDSGVGHVNRGGSWYSFHYFLRNSHRVLIQTSQTTHRFDYGFRCARDVAP
jgi:formylglycine-generating enzyme required for sulfatase activity